MPPAPPPPSPGRPGRGSPAQAAPAAPAPPHGHFRVPRRVCSLPAAAAAAVPRPSGLAPQPEGFGGSTEAEPEAGLEAGGGHALCQEPTGGTGLPGVAPGRGWGLLRAGRGGGGCEGGGRGRRWGGAL